MNTARFILILVFATPAQGGAGEEALRAGNELYRAGSYEDALAAYESAGDDDALTLFNRACALQRLGRDEETRELLRRVDAMTRRDDLAASARYNLGGASVEQARSLAEEGRAGEALEAYRRAARLYRDAYAMNTDDRDAARNIEIVGREAKALLEQIRAQREAMRQMADRLEDLQQQQQEEAESNQSPAPQQSADDADAQRQEARRRQESINQQTQAARDQLREMQEQSAQSQQGTTAASQPDPLERAAERVEDALRDQEQAQQRLDEGDQDGAADSQRDAAEDLREALRELTGQPGDEQDSPNNPEEGEGEPAESDNGAQSDNADEQNEQREGEREDASEQQDGQGQAQQPSEADGGSGEAGDENADPLQALAEDLLEKEKNDRELLRRLRAQRRAQNAPVEKDW